MRPSPLAATLCLIVVSMSGLAALSPASFRQQPARPPQQTPELKKLDAWTGRWTTQGKLYDTAFSHAGEITITMTCAWSAYGGYMICDHLFSGPAGERNDLTIYTFNPADHSYKFYSVDQTGVPRAVPLTIEGNLWTYDSEMERDGKKIQIRTINDFSKPGIVTWNTKFSADAGPHWTLMNEGVDTKVR
jgi:hypothetical protein